MTLYMRTKVTLNITGVLEAVHLANVASSPHPHYNVHLYICIHIAIVARYSTHSILQLIVLIERSIQL